ncbi:hypothetical protein C8R46DRAFT_1044562 [Mycena filopes]|nr:hypothetical protein C8R46DRAFT_1044562 [Mycena filopes]
MSRTRVGGEGNEGGGIDMGRVAGESACGDGEDEEEYGDKRGVNDEGRGESVDESEHCGRRGTKAATVKRGRGWRTSQDRGVPQFAEFEAGFRMPLDLDIETAPKPSAMRRAILGPAGERRGGENEGEGRRWWFESKNFHGMWRISEFTQKRGEKRNSLGDTVKFTAFIFHSGHTKVGGKTKQ